MSTVVPIAPPQRGTSRVAAALPAELAANLAEGLTEGLAGPDADVLVEAVRVRFTSLPGAVLGQANAEVDGRRTRVQLTAAGPDAAAARLAEAFRRRVRAVAGGWRPRPWNATAPALPHTGSTRIVRVKSPALVWCSPDAAVRTMDAMDYDVHLFTDPATETDAVVHRLGPTGYRLTRTRPAAPPRRPSTPLTLTPYPAPVLTDRQAVYRMADADLPHLFYTDPATGRGHLLHRRHDGHLTLLTGAS